MAKVISVTLDEQMEIFIDEQIGQGKFRSPAEVVDAGLRLLQHQTEIKAGTAAGGSEKPQPFDFDNFLREHYRRHAL
jgi:antitoxin ParD1/3/4